MHQMPDGLLWALLAIALAAPIISTAVIFILRKMHETLFPEDDGS